MDLTAPYTVGATYQENILPSEQAKLGHDVSFWASTYEWSNGKLNNVGEQRVMLPDGVVVQRIEYVRVINEFITSKIRLCRGIYKKLSIEKPDLIMLHGMQTAIVSEICKYLDDNPHVKFIVDSHADYLNSANSWLSKNILHRVFYKKYVKKAYSYAQKVYCISPETRDYNIRVYGLDEEKLALLPLGGIILSDEEYEANRKEKRDELNIDNEIINIIHSGKLYPEKKTIELLEAFKKIDARNIHLTIVGSAENEVLEALENSTCDSRISWLGWKSGDELTKYLCSGDVYCLPGDQSATVQSSMCCRCGVLIYPYENYTGMGLNDNCYVESSDELEGRINMLANNPAVLEVFKREAFDYAKRVLDYSGQAKRILESL